DIYGRVQQWQNILKAVKACLEEIKLTGEAEAGACKALFTQYACDLLTWVAVKGAMIITKGIDATQEKRPDQVPLGEAMTIGLTEAVTSFKEDYGGAARLAPDFSMERLIHAVCIFAFTNEWEPGFGGLFGADREGPPRQSAVFIAPAKRELLGSDPISGKAYFEYRVGVSFTAGSKIRYYDVKLKCDAEGDCPGTIPNPRLFKSSPEIKTGRISNIEQNEFSSVQGVMYVDGLDYRYNKVEVCWRSEAGDKYSGCDEADITPVVDATLFGCRATPGAGLGGNDLFGCEIFATQSKSQFVRIPPARHTVTVVRDNQALDIPFSIQTIYETPEEEANPYLLSIEEITQSGLGARPVEDEFPLPDGLITHEQVGTMPSVRYGEIFGSGLATITVEPEDNSTESRQTCSSAVIDPGPVTASTTLYVHFSGLENKKISINEKRGGEPYGLTSDNCEPGINYCCGGTLCNYANKKLTLKIEGSTVTIPSPQQKARCKISITGGEGSRQQLVKKYRISIHSNNGEGGFGPVVYVGEQEQSYDVEVTLNRGEMTMAQPQEVREGQVRIYSPFTEYRVEKLGDSVNVIEIQGNYNFVRYYIENEAGKVVQDGYEFSQTQINEIKTTKNNMPEFEIKDPRITSPGVYFLKIQAGNQIAGQAFRPQTGEVQLNIGTGEVKLNKPVNLRELEQYELVTNPNVRVVTIEWKSNPNIEHIVKSEQEGILQNVAKGIGRLSLEISKGAKEKNVTIQVIAKSGTVTSDPSEITVTIPGGTGAGGSGLPTP
ncbi:hypothetical protein KY345_05330, partial [Candidatus Woesearchaeota archaeon]|nr:hypothetical protein [Candidatus Woesearchaeota archaeon]